MKKLVLLKLGGSLITDKSKPFTLRTDNIKRIAIEVSEAIKNKNLNVIIGTGAGSFGHYPVQQYGIEEGLKTDKHRYGFCSVHNSVSKLNGIVVEALLEHTIKAFSLHPSSMMMAKNRDISQFFYEPIIRMVEIGVIPVLHGDVIYDRKHGSSIFSVEKIFAELIMQSNARRKYSCSIIYAGVTDGVLDAKKKTVPVITKNNSNTIRSLFFNTEGYDVTGGMQSKVLSCLQMTAYGVESLIINGITKGNIKKALLGKETKGTRVINGESESARLCLKS